MVSQKKKVYRYVKCISFFVLFLAVLLFLIAHVSYFSSFLDQNSRERSVNLRAHIDRLVSGVKENSDQLKALKLKQGKFVYICIDMTFKMMNQLITI